MVKRKVTLAHTLTAVYALSKPCGASKKEIVKFCVNRFGIQHDSRLFESVLERAVDQGLLKCFKRRYRLALARNNILWGPEKRERGCRVRARVGRNKAKRNSQKFEKSVGKPKKASSSRSRISSYKRVTKSSSLYKLWCKDRLRTEMVRRKKQKRGASLVRRACAKAKSKRNTSGRRRSGPVTRSQTSRKRAGSNYRMSSKIKSSNRINKLRRKRKAMKYNLRSKRAHRKKVRKAKISGKVSSKSSKHSRSQANLGKNEDFHRRILMTARNAVSHAKSWDRLNHSRQKNQLENQELMKNCQLVQKILTRCHGRSWDTLNHELRRIKDVQSCHKNAELKESRGRSFKSRPVPL